jgi:hypothetical protein
VIVHAEQLSPEEQRDWSSRLTALYNDCGCKAGAAGLLLGTVMAAGGLLLERGSGAGVLRIGSRVVRRVALVSVAGKAMGVASRRGRLSRATRELSRALSD